jgi:methanogenic corrinoid protein MtbC1
MVGGAPLTSEIAKQYGADGYAGNAGEAVRETLSVIARMKERQAK